MKHRVTLSAAATGMLVALTALLASCAAPAVFDTSGMSFSREPLIGKVVWNDLITEDLPAARRFYGGVFGWTFEDTRGAAGNQYVLVRSGSVFVAGIVPIAAPADGRRLSRWLPYFSVADVDAAIGKAAAAGGSVAAGPLDAGLGRVVAIIDPQGAVVGLARSSIGDPDDATTAPGAGRRIWTELLSNDPRASAAFYAAVVGLESRTIARRGGEYTMLASGGQDRAGILRNPADGWTPAWLTSFGVEDVAAAAARAESRGGKVIVAPSPDLREGTMAVVEDPSGAVLVLQQFPTEVKP